MGSLKSLSVTKQSVYCEKGPSTNCNPQFTENSITIIILQMAMQRLHFYFILLLKRRNVLVPMTSSKLTGNPMLNQIISGTCSKEKSVICEGRKVQNKNGGN